MMVEIYPNLKEAVGGSIPGCEISYLLDRIRQVVNCLMCFGVGLSIFCVEEEEEEEQQQQQPPPPPISVC